MDETDDIILGFFILLLIGIGLFFLCRHIILWYYRINERVKLEQAILTQLKEMNKELKNLNKKLPESAASETEQETAQ